MEITKMNSPNFGYPRGTSGRNGHKPEIIVNHVSGGYWDSNMNWIMTSGSGSSYTYYVRLNGQIINFVDEDNAPYSNGVIDKPTYKYLKPGINPNLYTLSIVREGHNHHVPTEEQYQSILYLHKMLTDKYNIPRTRDYIIGHNEISSVNRWYCPGSGFPWDRLMNDLNKKEEVKEEILEMLKVQFLGKDIEIEDYVKQNDKNYVSIREVFEKIGLEVNWDSAEQKVDITLK